LIFITLVSVANNDIPATLTKEPVNGKDVNDNPNSEHARQISLTFEALPSLPVASKKPRRKQTSMAVRMHELLPSCQCRKGRTVLILRGGKIRPASYCKTVSCLSSIPEPRRVQLHKQFRALSKYARLAWIKKHIEVSAKKKIGPKVRLESSFSRRKMVRM